ncbi:MAG: thioredoxin domain-containing protein [Candidatus Omnitrophica bacterium]|nr:thioredoxin domain-containing protein [Candidatus Omnitrophota bacterium]
MKNNILKVVLVVMVGVLAGTSLLLGIGNMVSVALWPLMAQVREMTVIQRDIQRKLNSQTGGNVTAQLMVMNQRLALLEAKLNGAAAFAQNQRPFIPPQEDFNKVYTIAIGDSPVLGKKDVPVTIVEFSDFQCPFCARFHPSVKKVLKAYPDKVSLVIKNFPLSFHPNARPSAKLALAAHLQGKYFETVDLLLQNGGAVNDDKIKEYAKTLGLNYKKLMDDYKNKDAQWEKRISDDLALGGQVDVRGTPTFFINGRKTSARDFDSYKAAIDKILSGKQ